MVMYFTESLSKGGLKLQPMTTHLASRLRLSLFEEPGNSKEACAHRTPLLPLKGGILDTNVIKRGEE